MYSFRVTLWECMSRKLPHLGKTEAAIYSLAFSDADVPMLPCSTELLDFDISNLAFEEKDAFDILQRTASSCLSRDRAKRPTASEAICMLEGIAGEAVLSRIGVQKIKPSFLSASGKDKPYEECITSQEEEIFTPPKRVPESNDKKPIFIRI
jgi:hypothetical protein